MTQLPEKFTERFRGQLSAEEASLFFSALQTEPPVSIRLNPQKKNSHLLLTEQVAWCKDGYYLPERPVFTLDPGFHAGTYYVQEAGSMLIEQLLSPYPEALNDVSVLDVCAAPGGKSTHLLALIDEKSVLVSNEIIPNRNKTLRYNLSKWGYANKIVTQSEPSRLSTSNARFDLILVDAPCSGEGLFRKDPEAMSEWSADRAAQCALRQENILNDIIPLLKSGGWLLYSTCTYNPAENDDRIHHLLSTGKFELKTGTAPAGIVQTKYGWQAFPHLVRSEGFYCSLLQYTGTDTPTSKNKNPQPEKSRELQTLVNEWLQPGTDLQVYSVKPYLYFANEKTAALVHSLNGAYLREFGIPTGEIKGKDLIPEASLALSIGLSNEIPSVELSKDAALEFLKCGNIRAEGVKNGWHTMNYDRHPLGWSKKINQRWNNYHPKEFRILMNTDNRE